jgi:hypothetical protein
VLAVRTAASVLPQPIQSSPERVLRVRETYSPHLYVAGEMHEDGKNDGTNDTIVDGVSIGR